MTADVLQGDDDEILLGSDGDILLGVSQFDETQRVIVPAAERRVAIPVNEARRVIIPAGERHVIVAVERRACAPTGP